MNNNGIDEGREIQMCKVPGKDNEDKKVFELKSGKVEYYN